MTLDLAFRATGSGPPLVLLHGLFGSGANWQGLVRRMEGRFRLHALDLRNHGSSPWSDAMDYPSMAEDVAAFIVREIGAPCVVLGHSMGGKTAMALALAHADLVSALVVADIAPVAYPQHDYRPIIAALQSLDTGSITDRASAEHALAARIPDDRLRGFLLTNLVREVEVWRWRLNLVALAEHHDRLTGWPDLEAIYAGRVLFLAGARSSYVDPAGQVEARRFFPQAQFRSIEAAGHWLHIEQPGAFVEQVSVFLAGP